MKVTALPLLTLLVLFFVKSGFGENDTLTWLKEKFDLLEPLQSKLQLAEDELKNQTAEIDKLKEWVKEKVDLIEPLQLKLKAAEDELKNQTVEIDKLKTVSSTTAPQIAFSVSLADSEYVFRGPPASQEKVLLFEKVFSNIGDGYDPKTGAFTAPVSGYYFFTFSTYDYNNYPSGAYMLKNGVVQISTYEHTSTDTSDSSSNSAVLQLAAGDKIHIELWEGSRVIDSSNHHTTFSGFLLYEIK